MNRILLLTIFVFASFVARAQVTTATLTGIVKDSKGDALPGATVLAVHTPSGTQYGTASRSDGRYTIPNARVGGPYTITVSFVGYLTQERPNVYLSLGNTANENFEVIESNLQLNEVVVTASNVFNEDRTGAATNVSNRTIQSVPTISRGLKDFTKLSRSEQSV
jgi:hypothetical protein